MALPQITAQTSPRAGVSAAPQQPVINVSGLVRGLQDLDEGLRIRKQKRDKAWANTTAMRAEADLAKYMQEANMNPKQNQVEDFESFWQEYSDTTIKEAPSENAANELVNRFNMLTTAAVPRVLGVEAKANAIVVDKQITGMFSSVSDVIALEPSKEVLDANIGAITTAIDDVAGSLISTEAAEKYKMNLTNIRMQAVDLWMLEDPGLAKEVLSETQGISGSLRAAKLKQIQTIEQQGRQVDNALLSEDYKSYLSSLKSSGTGSFDVEAYVSTFPVSQQVGKRSIINDDIAVAEGFHSFSQAIRGVPPNQMDSELAKLQPKAGDESHHRKTRLYAEAQQLVATTKVRLNTDPFAVAADSDVVNQVTSMYNSMPEDAEGKEQMLHDVVAANLRVQAEMGVPKNARKVASKQNLESIAAELNKADVNTVVTRINQLKSLYGDYYPDIFRNLVELPSDTRVSTQLRIVEDHIGQTTAPWVYEFIDATRQSVKDLGFTDRDATDYGESIASGSFQDLQESMIGAGGTNAFGTAREVKEALSKWAMHLEKTGQASSRRDAARKAREMVIDAAYAFGKAQGQTYAIPRQQPGYIVDDNVADKIEYALTETLDPKIQSKYEAVFGVESKPTVTPFHIGMVAQENFNFGPNDSAEFKAKVIEDAVRTHGYWATNATGDGVVLMSKMSGTGRARQVIGKDKEPIEVKFSDAVAWTEAIKQERRARFDRTIQSIKERR